MPKIHIPDVVRDQNCPVCSGSGKNPEHPTLQCNYCGGRGTIAG